GEKLRVRASWRGKLILAAVIGCTAWRPRPSGWEGNRRFTSSPECQWSLVDSNHVPVPAQADARAGDYPAPALRPRPLRVEPRHRAAVLVAGRSRRHPRILCAGRPADRGPRRVRLARQGKPDGPAAGPARLRPGHG